MFPGGNITQINPEVFLQKGETFAACLDVSIRAAELFFFSETYRE